MQTGTARRRAVTYAGSNYGSINFEDTHTQRERERDACSILRVLGDTVCGEGCHPSVI